MCISVDCDAERYFKSTRARHVVSSGCYSDSSSTEDTQDYMEGWKDIPTANATWVYQSEKTLQG